MAQRAVHEASSSTSVFLETSSISFKDISRAKTTRDAPSSFNKAAPPGVCRLIWVEACKGISGQASRRILNRPMSWIKMPSTGTEHRNLQKSSASGSSSSFKSVLTVTYTRTLRSAGKKAPLPAFLHAKNSPPCPGGKQRAAHVHGIRTANTAAFRAAGYRRARAPQSSSSSRAVSFTSAFSKKLTRPVSSP